MRIVFMGTPDIAAVCLRRLVEDGNEIVGVYTKPDMPKNRGMRMTQSEVKQYAESRGLPVFQPDTFRNDAALQQLRALRPDVIAVVAYGKILPEAVLQIPPLGCINIHASILPQLRGAGPIQWAVLNGLEETGVSAMYMTKELDAGDVIEIRRTPIDPAETAGQLLERLSELGAALLKDTMARLSRGETLPRQPQDDAQATYAPMLTKALCPVDWTKPQRQILDQIRGLHPWPVATAEIAGKRFKLHAAAPVDGVTEKAPGTPLALTKQGLEMACGDGRILVLTRLQAEGGKQMAAPDYFRGHPIDL